MPGFGAAKEGDSDVSAQLEDIAIKVEVAFVGLAGLGVVEATAGCLAVAIHDEAGSDLKIAKRASAERDVRVVVIDATRRGRGDGDDLDAEVLGAGISAHDRAVGRLPIAKEPGSRGGEAQRDEEHTGEK